MRLGESRMKQAELSRKTGIRAATINELYHEFSESVKLEHLDKICEAFGCRLDELIVRDTELTPEQRRQLQKVPQPRER
jgi:DNA-binding Xre family transcriptional regulator